MRRPDGIISLGAAMLAALLASTQPSEAGQGGPGMGEAPRPQESAPGAGGEKWFFVPMFTFSSLTGRPSWEEYDTQLFYKISPKLTVGGEVDVRNRPPSGTDTLVSAMASYYPWKALELHGKATLTPSPAFSAAQIYQVGFEVRPLSRVSLLFDYEHFHYYGSGSIDQIKPGITFWMSDETFLTLGGAHGWAFGDTQYDGFGGKLNVGLPGKRRLILGYWHGADPERDLGVPKTISIKGETYSLYFQQPLRRNLDLILGVEYETHPHSYKRTSATIGFAMKF